MKKIITFLFLTTLFVGCVDSTFENSVENPETFTSYHIQNLPKDTLITANEPQTKLIYVFNKETNLVEYQVEVTRKNMILIPVGVFVLAMIFIFMLGMIVLIAAMD